MPGQPGHAEFFISLFFLQPGPVPVSGRPDPELTCRAGPGFKIMVKSIAYLTKTRLKIPTIRG